MISTFTDFRKLLSLVWKNQRKIPDCSLLFTGCMFSVAGCFLGATCLAYGASWIFVLLYILLGMAGSIICCISGFKIFSMHITELLPLVSSKSKNPERKTMLKKTSSKDRNLFSFHEDGKSKNYSVNQSLHRDIFCRYEPRPTHTETKNTNENDEKITFVDCYSNRNASVCHDKYITGPAPRRRNKERTRDERQPQTRGALSFVRKIFRLPSVFKRRVSNPTPQAEISLGDLHRNVSEEVFPSVELSRSVHDSVGMQTEQSAPRNVMQRTYENVPPPGGQKVTIPQTWHLRSGSRQYKTSDIQGSLAVVSPYQNVPSHEHRITDCPSKLDISSTHAERSESFSPERCNANVVASDLPKTYRDYENVYQIRPGHYVPVHSTGTYCNITVPCQKSRQSMAVSDTTSRSAYSSPEKNYEYSSKAHEKSLLSAISVSEKRMTSTGQLADEEEEVSGKRNQPVDSFHELGVSSPYVNIPASWWQMIKYRQYKDAAENVQQSSLSKMEKYSSVLDRMSLENVSGTRDKFSNTQSEQNLISLGYDLSHLNILPSFDGERQQTSIDGTSKNREPVFQSPTKRRFEVEERILPEKQYNRSNTSPLQDFCRTDKDKIKRFLPKESKSIPLALKEACQNIHLSKDYEERSIEIPEVVPTVQDMNQSKRSKYPSITRKRLSTRTLHRRKEKPQERHLQFPEIRTESHSEDFNFPNSGSLPVNIYPKSDPEKKVSDVHGSETIAEVKSLPKSESRSVITRSDTERKNIAESFKEVQRLLPLSDKNQFRAPTRQSRHVVSETKPEYLELWSREKLQFQAREFSNKLYYSISELETKGCNVPQLHCAHPVGRYKNEKPESEQDCHTESEKSFLKVGINIESNQSASHKLSLRKSNLLDQSMSRESSYERETNLLTSDEQYVREQNIKKYTSRDEASAALKVQPKKTPVAPLCSADEIYAKLHVSKDKINTTQVHPPLPLKLKDKPSELEKHLGDTIVSSDLDRVPKKGKRDPALLENMCVTGKGPRRMSYIIPNSSGFQGTESVQRNPTEVEREYGNPTVGKALYTTEKQSLETEKVPEKVHETEEKKADVLRSQGSLLFAVGSPERPTRSQVSERFEVRGSCTLEFGGDDPVETGKSECNEMNETSNSSQEKESLTEQRIRKPNFNPTQRHADASCKIEDQQAVHSPKKFEDTLLSSSSYDSHRLSELTRGSKENKSSSYLSSIEKYASFPRLCNKKPDGSWKVGTSEGIHSYPDGTSQRQLRFVSDRERNIIPVPQYADDVYQLESRVATTSSSKDTNESIEKSYIALSVTKSSDSSDTRSPVVSYTPQYSPSKVKTLIQEHGRNPLPRNSSRDVPPTQQRFVAPSGKFILPVIRSSVSSTIARYPLTQTRSASVQQLKTLSPLKNRSHPKYVASLEDKLSKRSPTRTADPISHSFSPSSQMIATSPTDQFLEKYPVTTGEQLKTKSASKQQVKSVRVSLPETPLTLLRSPKKIP